MFFGIIIEMYYAPKEYNHPRIHVRYQGNKASVNINTCEHIEGNLNRKKTNRISSFIYKT